MTDNIHTNSYSALWSYGFDHRPDSALFVRHILSNDGAIDHISDRTAEPFAPLNILCGIVISPRDMHYIPVAEYLNPKQVGLRFKCGHCCYLLVREIVRKREEKPWASGFYMKVLRHAIELMNTPPTAGNLGSAR